MKSAAIFRYQVAPEDAGRVTLAICDVAGREVRTLVKEFRAAGSYQAAWDRTDNSGAKVRGGIYFSQLRVGTTSVREEGHRGSLARRLWQYGRRGRPHRIKAAGRPTCLNPV